MNLNFKIKYEIMEVSVQKTPLSNMQLELLKLYANNVNETDLLAIRKLIADYFSQNLIKMADDAWKKNEWTAEDMNKILNEENQ